MKTNFEKNLLYILYVCIVITLAVPLVVGNGYFFPYIFPKAVVFRSIVALMAVVFLLLQWKNNNYAPKFTIFTWFLTVFIAVATVASLFGIDMQLSFWGTFERSEGLLLWLHLLVYFIIVSSVLQQKDNWLAMFDVFIVCTLLMGILGLGQALRIEGLYSPGGTRITSTIGNAAFYAAYQLFAIALAVYMATERKHVLLRLYYVIAGLIFTFLLFQTQVRGAVLGFVAAIGAVSVLLLINRSVHPLARKISGGILVLIALSAVGIYSIRNQPWIEQYQGLNRLATISLSARTAETRLASWGAAWQGWSSRPVLGYGLEHFSSVFDKNFPVVIYEDEGSEVWFDRAHNFIFDRLATTGILGFIAYFGFLLMPLFLAWKILKHNPKSYITAYIAIGLTVAYIIQNLFVFESVTTYIALMFVWAFWSWIITTIPEISGFATKTLYNKSIMRIAAVLSVILFIPAMIFFNIHPARANKAAAQAVISSGAGQEAFFDSVSLYQRALEYSTYGIPEFQIEFIDYVGTQLASIGEVSQEVMPILEYTEKEIERLHSLEPYNTKAVLVAMRYFNYTHKAIAGKEEERLQKALSYLPKLEELSPTRPHIYQEAGYTHLYLARLYGTTNRPEESNQQMQKASGNFQKAIDLNPKVVESHLSLLALHLEFGNSEMLFKAYETMKQNTVEYAYERYITRLIATANTYKNFEWSARFAQDFTQVQPENIDAWINLALAYAYAQKPAEARQAAEVIVQKWPNEQQAVDTFLEDLEAGRFKDKKTEE